MISLNIVAHPDDDLLFLNPDIFEDTEHYNIYMTYGDDGDPFGWKKHEGPQIIWGNNNYFFHIKSNSFKHGDVFGELYWVYYDRTITRPNIFGHTNTVSGNGIVAGLQALIAEIKPDVIRTHDPDTLPAIDHSEPHLDHLDHIYTAKFVQEAALSFPSIPVYAYMGYPIKYQPDNLSPEQTAKKMAMWRRYQEIDKEVAGEQWDIAMARCYKRKIQ